ncbi:MAG: futalosine hydrolase [Flavobacteriales bacterium]|nr:futalosine hydrolase [Flavobacteriales bacterium]|tara:strand:- start:1382 stop:1960 length:579 start_codon:yes stop_codon:yes gene_type:complete
MNVLIVAATKLEITSDKINDLPILLTGVGMVNTAINLTKELNNNDCDLVINMGVAGCFLDEIKIGDVVEVVEDCFSEIGFEDGESFSEFSDFEIKTEYKIEEKTRLRKVKGITVNTVHGNENSINNIVERLHPDIESMEGAAVFKVCEEMKIPCMQIRSISNKVEKRNKENWNLDLAISNLNIEVEKIISTL